MNEFFELSNGLKIPKVGLGTWLIDNDKVEEVVECALEAGYRHIDTAQAYGNEEGVGKAIRKSNIARQDLFITSKIAAEAKTYQEAYDSINETLNKTVVMVTHDPKMASYGKRTLFLKDGVILDSLIKKESNEKYYEKILNKMVQI